MSTYRKPKSSDWTKSLLAIGIYVAVISVTAFILLVTYWYVWLAIVAGGLFLIILWHKKSTAYHCPKCGNEFEISVLIDFFSPHGITKEGDGWTYLKCPKCQNRTKMEILVKNKKNGGAEKWRLKKANNTVLYVVKKSLNKIKPYMMACVGIAGMTS